MTAADGWEGTQNVSVVQRGRLPSCAPVPRTKPLPNPSAAVHPPTTGRSDVPEQAARRWTWFKDDSIRDGPSGAPAVIGTCQQPVPQASVRR